MKRINFTILLIGLGLVSGLFLSSFTSGLQEPDAFAATVIKKAEDKLRGKSSIAAMKISIVRPKWTRTMEMKSWSKGEDLGLTLVTAPARDKGVVYLRKDKEVWNWVPSVERIIKLPPSMMSQSWMGTDLTNDDLVKQSDLKDDFKHSYKGLETIAGRKCHRIESIPTESAAVVWGKIITWIDEKDFIQMKTEFYDEDDYLVNTFTAGNIKVMGGKNIASRIEIIPADKPGQKTILEYLSLEFDTAIDDNFFTTQNMKRVK